MVMRLAQSNDHSAVRCSVCYTRFLGSLGEQLTRDGVQVVSVAPRSHRTRHLVSLNVLREIRRQRPDVVHTHGLQAISAVGPLACAGMLPPWIHTFHFGNYPYSKRRWMWIERVFSRRATHLVAVSEAQRSIVIQHHGIQPSRIRTIPNGVLPNPHVDDAALRATRRRALGLAEDAIVVGTVAVLTEQKGVTYLLQAAKKIHERQPAVRFLILGGGPLEEALQQEARELGISDVVTFTGWRADVSELLPLIDVYVMSSLWEAMPLALLEAMAAGRAIVVTDVGDNAKVVNSGESGVIVRPRDVDGLATAIGELLGNPANAARLGTNALKRCAEFYSVDRMVGAYERLYTSLARP